MKKVLLIYPYFLDVRLQAEDISVVPQGVFYIAAVLKENHYDVEILNWYNFNENPNVIKKILAEKQPDVIGVSIVHANRWGGIEIARIAKQVLPDAAIVFGGVGATFLWEHLLNHFPEIDYIVIGEGDYSLLNLLDCIVSGDTQGVEKIKGIAFRASGKPLRTASAAAICDLDDLPLPARHFSYQHVSLTRGCGANCTFCGSPQFWGRRVRFHSADYFVEQLERLNQRGISFFYVSDDTFTVNKKRAIEVCRKIIKKDLKISWSAISRVDHVDEELLLWMRKASCIQISYGVESGSPAIRKYFNKQISNEQIIQAFVLTQQYGIMARAYFIYGCPGENRQTIQETLDLINEIKPLGAIFYVLDIFPGTALYADLQRNSGVTDDIWLKRIEDIMYFETDPDLTPESILDFGRILRTGFYGSLPAFVDAIELVDKEELYPLHADFCSRLALTFDQGDYAGVDAIAGKKEIAASLYLKSLQYHPDSRAFLGLGIYKQREKDYEESITILTQGLSHFPQDPQLNICVGISLMNLGRFDTALEHFLKFEYLPQSVQLIADCYRAMGRPEKASE